MENENSQVTFEQLQSALFIDESDIDEELRTQAAKYCYAGVMFVEKELEYDNMVAEFKHVVAKMRRDERKRLEALGKKPTDAMLTEAVESNPVYLQWQKQINSLKYLKDRHKVHRDSWNQKKDTLVALSYNKRSEMKNQVQSESARGGNF